MEKKDIEIGIMVKTNRDFVDVLKGTKGMIIEDYGTGIMIAWDLPNKKPLPNKSPEEILRMYAINPECPLRDGFDKETELQYLDLVKGK